MRAGRAIARRLRRSTGAVEVQHGRGPGSEGDVVFAGPLPPAPTGIATYDRAVLDGLERIGFTDRLRMDVVWPVDTQDAGRFPGYHLGVFQLGNNVDFHLEIYRAAYLTSALVVLHDLALDDFVRGLKAAGEPLGYMAAREAARLRHELTDPDVLRNEPLARAVVCPRRAAGARRDRPLGLRSAVPGRVRVSHAGLRRAAPRDRGTGRVRAALAQGARAAGRPRRSHVPRRRPRRHERGEAARRPRAGRHEPGGWRPRRDRGPPHRGLRRGAGRRGGGGRCPGERACRRRGRRLPRLARRGRRGRRPALPASRRGERLAQPCDAGRAGPRS